MDTYLRVYVVYTEIVYADMLGFTRHRRVRCLVIPRPPTPTRPGQLQQLGGAPAKLAFGADRLGFLGLLRVLSGLMDSSCS